MTCYYHLAHITHQPKLTSCQNTPFDLVVPLTPKNAQKHQGKNTVRNLNIFLMTLFTPFSADYVLLFGIIGFGGGGGEGGRSITGSGGDKQMRSWLCVFNCLGRVS